MHIKLISSSSNFESHPCQLENTENKHQHTVTLAKVPLSWLPHRSRRADVDVLMLPYCVSFQNNNDRDVHAAVDYYNYQ